MIHCRCQRNAVKSIGGDQSDYLPAYIIIVLNETAHPVYHTLQRPLVLSANLGEHHLVCVAEVAYLSGQGLRLHLLHLIEHTSGGGHVLEDLLNHLERHHAGGNPVKHIPHGYSRLSQFLELPAQLLQDRHSGLGQLPYLGSPEERGRPYLSVGENEPVHTDTKSGGDIGQHLGRVVELIQRH